MRRLLGGEADVDRRIDGDVHRTLGESSHEQQGDKRDRRRVMRDAKRQRGGGEQQKRGHRHRLVAKAVDDVPHEDAAHEHADTLRHHILARLEDGGAVHLLPPQR